MNKLYRFSPITTREKLLEAIGYVADKATQLCRKITGNEHPISGLTIFSHYPEEFQTLKKIQLEIGVLQSEYNGLYVCLHQPIYLAHNKLELLRVRIPDPYRMQVGCCDFEVENYQNFKREFLSKNPNNLRLIERPEYEMIEFFDPDYDVLAYVVSA